MAHSIDYKKTARAELALLPQETHKRVIKAISKLADDPRPSGCVKLKGSGLYRIRVGDYRIIYDIQDDALVILVVKVGHRGDVYSG